MPTSDDPSAPLQTQAQTQNQPPTALAQGNHALRHHALGLVDEPSHQNGPIAAQLAANLVRARRRYRQARWPAAASGAPLQVAVVCWSLSENPADLVHPGKPRMPSLLFRLLYRLLWDACLLLDCDDDELAFVGAAHARPLADWLQTHGSPPTLADLPGRRWSELAGIRTPFIP
ncbi:hypothetical protein Thiowin_00103 [Thiorhodovibrio winogradskyi]|uniref:Uncharacterized protein n=1 Tax=Thiorhodovibrio winogradskyi TaxID=77007 RepID=A0ABZ0S6X1_9GAMM|nr:hypothetical protein [Thiorhodovibrio winogradskyi]